MSAGLNCESTLSKSYSLRLGAGSSDNIVAPSVDVAACDDDVDVSVPFSLGLLTSRAQVGQAVAHVPHPTHFAWSMVRALVPSS